MRSTKDRIADDYTDNADLLNRKPNYYSVMNYTWIHPNPTYPENYWRLDYSHVALDPLDESNLIEGNGITGADDIFAAIMTPYGSGGKTPVILWAKTDGSPVDWNGNDDIDPPPPPPVAVDINYLHAHQDPSPNDLLSGRADWPNLRFRLFDHGHFADGVHGLTPEEQELTVEMAQEIAQTPPPPGVCVRDPAWICDGDVDGDGQVNPVDSGLVQGAIGSPDEQDVCNYDIDCSGFINPVDVGIVQSLFGTCDAPRAVCDE